MKKSFWIFTAAAIKAARYPPALPAWSTSWNPWRAEGIPCVRIYPAEEVVQEQVYHLQILNISARENQGKLAVIVIHFDYIFDEEEDLFIREWEKMKYQNEFKEQVYAAAQRMEAAVFGSGLDQFFIATSRNMLMNGFLKKYEHWKLLQFGQRSSAFRVWLGIGIGNTMLEAKSRAHMALNHSMADRPGSSYLAEDEHQATRLQAAGSEGSAEHSASYFARKIQVGIDTLEKIDRVLREYGDTVTSDELSERLGITPRSVNRILSRLEEEGCVTLVGKRSTGKGRPARVMRLTLPESLRAGGGPLPPVPVRLAADINKHRGLWPWCLFAVMPSAPPWHPSRFCPHKRR